MSGSAADQRGTESDFGGRAKPQPQDLPDNVTDVQWVVPNQCEAQGSKNHSTTNHNTQNQNYDETNHIEQRINQIDQNKITCVVQAALESVDSFAQKVELCQPKI